MLTPEWFTKDEAAQRLKMSVRSVQAAAAAGKIGTRKELDPATNQQAVRYSSADVERMAYERAHPEASPAEPRQALQAPRALKVVDPSALDLLQLLTAARAPVAAVLKPWLTLEEAEDYTGLSRALLVRLIHQGCLPALQDEPRKLDGEKRARKGSSWRLCRRDLDRLDAGDALPPLRPARSLHAAR